MGLQKQLIHQGTGHDRARYGDTVTFIYSGHVYDAQQPQNGCRGKQFWSRNNQPFTTEVKENLVVEGWIDGITKLDGGMRIGERAVFIMSHDWAYGECGFPGLIPPYAKLIFDIEIVAINGKRLDYTTSSTCQGSFAYYASRITT